MSKIFILLIVLHFQVRNSRQVSSTMYPMNETIETSRTGELIIGIIVNLFQRKYHRSSLIFLSFSFQSYSIIILLSIIGNVIVVTAISRVQRLRHPTNFILMSLAIADLLVTTTVMIPGFIYEIKQKWIFGRVFWNIWVANDITFCTASILHLGTIVDSMNFLLKFDSI